MPDYSKGKIYALRSPHTDLIYIGSTTQSLSKRIWQHKDSYNKWKKGDFCYLSSYKLMELGDCYIELIEEYQCENKSQLDRKEGEVVRNTPNCVNKNIAGRTNTEYRQDTKLVKQQKDKEYREKNKEKIANYFKEYYIKRKMNKKNI